MLLVKGLVLAAWRPTYHTARELGSAGGVRTTRGASIGDELITPQL